MNLQFQDGDNDMMLPLVLMMQNPNQQNPMMPLLMMMMLKDDKAPAKPKA